MKQKNQMLFYGLFALICTIVFFIVLEPKFKDISQPDQIMVNHPIAAPSALIIPNYKNPQQKIDLEQYRGQVVLVHFFASWCGHCRDEHPLMMEIAKIPNLVIVGVNYKDDAKNLTAWLKKVGNPYTAIGLDKRAEVAEQWNVLGTPTSFVLNKRGEIIFHHNGEFTPQIIHSELQPVIEQAMRIQM